MNSIVRFLNQVAGGTSALYRIVFTSLLLFEVVRRRRRGHEEATFDRANRRSR